MQNYSIFLLFGMFSLYVGMACKFSSYIKDIDTRDITISNTKNAPARLSELITITKDIFYGEKENFTKTETTTQQTQTTANIAPNNKIIDRSTLEVPLPDYTRGVYIANPIAQSKQKMQYFIEKAAQYQLNTFVIDVQKRMVPREIVDMVKIANVFPVARVVVVEGGLKQKNFSKQRIDKTMKLIEDASAQGFHEVQLDYIRYADIDNLLNLPLSYKYNVIRSFLSKAKETAHRENMYLSADLFGRITLNEHDQIGQRLEIFGRYTQTLYPMLYPSHYTNDHTRMSKPYDTIEEGIRKSKKRLPKHRIVAYIQGFNMKVRQSGLSFTNYIKAQIKACEDSASSDGWIIWNSRNEYSASFRAIRQHEQEKKESKKSDQDGSQRFKTQKTSSYL